MAYSEAEMKVNCHKASPSFRHFDYEMDQTSFVGT